MNLTIDSLREMGAFTGAPVERQITWKQRGKEFTYTVFVRPLSFHTAVTDLRSLGGRSNAVAGRIASCICDEKGKPVFAESDVTGFYADGSPVLELANSGEPIPATDDDGNAMVHDDGSPVYRERGALPDGLSNALMMVISEVSGLGEIPAS